MKYGSYSLAATVLLHAISAAAAPLAVHSQCDFVLQNVFSSWEERDRCRNLGDHYDTHFYCWATVSCQDQWNIHVHFDNQDRLISCVPQRHTGLFVEGDYGAWRGMNNLLILHMLDETPHTIEIVWLGHSSYLAVDDSTEVHFGCWGGNRPYSQVTPGDYVTESHCVLDYWNKMGDNSDRFIVLSETSTENEE